jgi:aspartyl-tRNA(Asn)/glutamyl-tRNA(Gln) amidotransferase subunit A
MIAIREAGVQLRKGELSAVDLVANAVESLEQWEPYLHAWASYDPELALRAAEERDKELLDGVDRGSLHGIPIAVKDNLTTIDYETRCGSKVFASSSKSKADAASVARLRDAGAIVLGKTRLHEHAMGNPYVSDVTNPYSREHNASGSSSGTAAAVAAGTVAGGLGTDSGGSVRLPSAVCGVSGLKPTYGRVSLDGVLGSPVTMDHVGPIARYVEDVFLLFDALDMSPRPPLDQPSVVGVISDIGSADPAPAVRASVMQVAERLAERGLETREIELGGLELLPYAAIAIAYAEISSQQRQNLRDRSGALGAAIRPLLRLGSLVTADDYLLAQRARTVFSRTVAKAFDAGVDVLIMPTTPLTAGHALDDVNQTIVVGGEEPDLFRFTRFTLPWNLTGHPALTVPCGIDESGLPIGVQLVARRNAESHLRTVGLMCEEDREWLWPTLESLADERRQPA